MRKSFGSRSLVGLMILSIVFLFITGVSSGAEKETLTMWQAAASELLDSMLPVIKQFEVNNPDVEVIVELITGNWVEKVVISFAGGTEPDVIHFMSGYMRPYPRAGLVVPVTGHGISKSYMEEEFFKGMLGDVEWQGEYYGIPSGLNTNGAIVYNKEFFEEAGISVPFGSHTEIIEAAQKLTIRDSEGEMTRAGLKVYGGCSGNIAYWERYLLQCGGTLIGNGGWGDAVFDSPEGLRALQLYVDLFEKHKVDDVNFGVPNVTNNFAGGLAAMVWGGGWISKRMDLDFPEISWGHTQFPPLPGAEPSFYMDSCWAHWVSAKSANKKGVWKFIELLADPEVVAGIALRWGIIPAMTEPAYRPEFIEDPHITENILATKYMRYRGDLRSQSEYYKIIGDMLTKVLHHKATLKEALSTAQEEMNQMFAEVDATD